MKLRIDQLHVQLKHQLAPVYVISGDEQLQIAECCDQIRSKAKFLGFTERYVYYVNNSFNWQEFLKTAKTISLFTQKKILEVRMFNGKLNNLGQQALIQYLNHLSSNNLLLIVIEQRLDGVTKKTKWFKTVEQKGIYISVLPVEKNKLPCWIAQRLHSQGFEISSEAILFLVANIEGNLLAVVQVIEHLKLLTKDRLIDINIMREVISDSARFNIFQLIDSALNGDSKGVVRILSSLKSEGIEVALVVWGLTREIRLLSHLSRLKSCGILSDSTLKQVAKIYGFSFFMLKKRKNILEKCIDRHSETAFRKMLIHTAHIDHGMKGLEKINIWDEILTLSLNLTGILLFNCIKT